MVGMDCSGFIVFDRRIFNTPEFLSSEMWKISDKFLWILKKHPKFPVDIWVMESITLLGTNISPTKALLKMIFLFPRWDMLVPWRVYSTRKKHTSPNKILRLNLLNVIRELSTYKVIRVFFRIMLWVDQPVIEFLLNSSKNYFHHLIPLSSILSGWIISWWSPLRSWFNQGNFPKFIKYFRHLCEIS